jgi:hypothetical protein
MLHSQLFNIVIFLAIEFLEEKRNGRKQWQICRTASRCHDLVVDHANSSLILIIGPAVDNTNDGQHHNRH